MTLEQLKKGNAISQQMYDLEQKNNHINTMLTLNADDVRISINGSYTVLSGPDAKRIRNTLREIIEKNEDKILKLKIELAKL